MRFSIAIIAGFLLTVAVIGCGGSPGETEEEAVKTPSLLDKYAAVRLTADLSALSPSERQMLPLLIEAADAMDEIFWMQAYGDKDALLDSITDPELRRFAEINYGPWDRLDDNAPFIDGVGPKPAGANFYPSDMTKEEFEAAIAENLLKAERFKSLYTVIRRNESGELEAVGYPVAFTEQIRLAAQKLKEASELAEDPDLERYLGLRAAGMMLSDYYKSDMAWMAMKNNTLDVVIGPVETYEDQLFGYKASAEAFILIKDKEWSKRLERYVSFLPELQRGLPVPDEYKQETPGTESELNAYDVVYHAGDCNAGSKTIAINLPNDEVVQAKKGTRRLQLKNSMRAKFDKILVPIVGELIAEDQRDHVTFDAFFANTMFHEVAHGLGIKKTLEGDLRVREVLQEQASALEEGKADVLGLYMVSSLHEKGEMGESDLRDNYVTFMASVFRSIRFGASSAHGRANLARFNFFEEMGVFSRDDATGTYRVDFDRMEEAVNALSEKILRFQGDGDYDGIKIFMETYGKVGDILQGDLDRLASAGIPVDIVFEQGPAVLGL